MCCFSVGEFPFRVAIVAEKVMVSIAISEHCGINAAGTLRECYIGSRLRCMVGKW